MIKSSLLEQLADMREKQGLLEDLERQQAELTALMGELQQPGADQRALFPLLQKKQAELADTVQRVEALRDNEARDESGPDAAHLSHAPSAHPQKVVETEEDYGGAPLFSAERAEEALRTVLFELDQKDAELAGALNDLDQHTPRNAEDAARMEQLRSELEEKRHEIARMRYQLEVEFMAEQKAAHMSDSSTTGFMDAEVGNLKAERDALVEEVEYLRHQLHAASQNIPGGRAGTPSRAQLEDAVARDPRSPVEVLDNVSGLHLRLAEMEVELQASILNKLEVIEQFSKSAHESASANGSPPRVWPTRSTAVQAGAQELHDDEVDGLDYTSPPRVRVWPRSAKKAYSSATKTPTSKRPTSAPPTRSAGKATKAEERAKTPLKPPLPKAARGTPKSARRRRVSRDGGDVAAVTRPTQPFGPPPSPRAAPLEALPVERAVTERTLGKWWSP